MILYIPKSPKPPAHTAHGIISAHWLSTYTAYLIAIQLMCGKFQLYSTKGEIYINLMQRRSVAKYKFVSFLINFLSFWHTFQILCFWSRHSNGFLWYPWLQSGVFGSIYTCICCFQGQKALLPVFKWTEEQLTTREWADRRHSQSTEVKSRRYYDNHSINQSISVLHLKQLN